MGQIDLLNILSRIVLPVWHPTTRDLCDLDHLGFIQLILGRRNRSQNPGREFHDSFVLRITPTGKVVLLHHMSVYRGSA